MLLFAETDVASIGTFVATGILALLTAVYVALTHKLVRAQTDPCVIVYLRFHESRPGAVVLVIENVGPGLAKDIRFELSRREIPQCADLVGGVISKERPTPMTVGPLIHGIPALAPGQLRKIDWGQVDALKAALGSEPVNVKCRFRRSSGLTCDNAEMEPTECILELASLEGVLFTESAEVEQVRHLERIANRMK